MTSGNIVVIGPTAAGKTTYLAALSYFKEHKQGKKLFTVNPQNPATRILAEKAENILKQAADLDRTVIGQEIESVDDLPFYSFGITAKPYWYSSTETFQLTARDYPGEVFEAIASPSARKPIHEDFINECFTDVIGCLIMLTGWEPGTDNFYNRIMKQFLKLMDERGRSQNLKLAIVMSKCERGEIWPGRLDPEIDLFGVHLRETTKTLREKVIPQNLRFFALSTFGVLGKDNPRPNREDRMKGEEPASVIREPDLWQPYNLIEPLYWLSKKQNQGAKNESI
jgi:energy-coupling factor transporter ATP-binding protein EcfA2